MEFFSVAFDFLWALVRAELSPLGALNFLATASLIGYAFWYQRAKIQLEKIRLKKLKRTTQEQLKQAIGPVLTPLRFMAMALPLLLLCAYLLAVVELYRNPGVDATPPPHPAVANPWSLKRVVRAS